MKQLGIKPGTKINYYMLLYGGFFLSGLAHEIEAYSVCRQIGTLAIRTFLWQAVAITIEDMIFSLSKRLGFNTRDKKQMPRWRWLGYSWVYGWLVLPPHMYEDALGVEIAKGWWRISYIMGIYRGEWFPSSNSTNIYCR